MRNTGLGNFYLLLAVKLFILILSVAAFIILFDALYPLINGAVSPLSLIPVILAGAFFGRVAGLGMSTLMVIITSIMFRSVQPEFLDSIPLDAIPNAVILFTAGVTVGWLRDTYIRLQKEIKEKNRYEKSLRESHDLLEKRVSERTRELQIANNQLKLEIAERENTEKKLVSSNEEKAILLKEIHHRVKNNLQIVSSLLNLQVNHTKDHEMIDILNDSQLRVRSIAFVHENLYQSPNLARINVDSYLNRLINHLAATFAGAGTNVEIHIEVKGIELVIDQAVPCGLIVNELVSNIYKHAFCDQTSGKIEVIMGRPNPGYIYLIVKDNGSGIEQSIKPDDASSLGMYLIHSLTAQLDGTIEFRDKNGTEVYLCFREE